MAAGGKINGKSPVLTGVMGVLIMFWWGCGVKVEQLPLLSAPYVSEVEFLKEVRNANGKAKKKYFEEGRVTSPFYFFLKVKEIENDGVLRMVFYESPDKSQKQVVEKVFQFGKAGKYYEYILFFDRVEGLSFGDYRYAVFLNQRLIYEGQVVVSQPSFSR